MESRGGVSIRRASIDDAAAAASVFMAARGAMTFLPQLHTADETRAFVRRFIEQGETWIAACNGGIAGLACLDRDWLEHLYVHPAFQNRGIGEMLLGRVKAERPHGFQLWTFQANASARRFYERHDCILVRLTDGSRNEEKLPDALYVWPGRSMRAT